MNRRHNEDMYKMYEEYKETLKICKKPLIKRQKLNVEIREKYSEPFKRRDHSDNKSDITNWNSMINELETNIKEIEMYLDFHDRYYLHKECDNVRSMILNKNSYEGEIPLENLYGDCTPDTTDIVCDIELQEEIVELLDEVLTERQRQVVHMYFWEGMTQDKIAKKIGLTQQGIGKILENSLEMLRKSINYDEIIEILQF